MFEEIKDKAKAYYKHLQNVICDALITYDGKSYIKDLWQREGGGGGETRIFTGGQFLEKGGVNFSEVYGESDSLGTFYEGEGNAFYATGISLVLHPINPYVPTVHANYRLVQRGDKAWFGGGCDLTPVYPEMEDVIHFHQTYYECLRPFGKNFYSEFKKNCDEYFYLKHRKETRGIGGIFFDHQSINESQNFEMVKACGDAFLKSYLPIVDRHKDKLFTEREKTFQQIRRGRYVEFNLLYDRGTLFGLKTNGRIESIFMSLPEHVQWVYNYKPEKNSKEARLDEYLKPRDWLKLD